MEQQASKGTLNQLPGHPEYSADQCYHCQHNHAFLALLDLPHYKMLLFPANSPKDFQQKSLFFFFLFLFFVYVCLVLETPAIQKKRKRKKSVELQHFYDWLHCPRQKRDTRETKIETETEGQKDTERVARTAAESEGLEMMSKTLRAPCLWRLQPRLLDHPARNRKLASVPSPSEAWKHFVSPACW